MLLSRKIGADNGVGGVSYKLGQCIRRKIVPRFIKQTDFQIKAFKRQYIVCELTEKQMFFKSTGVERSYAAGVCSRAENYIRAEFF